MAASDGVKHVGIVLVEIFGERHPRLFWADNLVVNSGLEWIADRLTSTPAVMSHMAAGSSGAGTEPTTSTLTTELQRVALTSVTGITRGTTYSALFGPGVATGSIAELGIFNAGSGGTMLNRVVFPPETKGPKDSMRVTWTVTQY